MGEFYEETDHDNEPLEPQDAGGTADDWEATAGSCHDAITCEGDGEDEIDDDQPDVVMPAPLTDAVEIDDIPAEAAADETADEPEAAREPAHPVVEMMDKLPADEASGDEATQEGGSYGHIPPASEVTNAYGQIVAHNDARTGLGRGMGTMIVAMVEQDLAEDEGREPRSLDEIMEAGKTEDDMYGEVEAMVHGDVLERIGITLKPLGEHLATAGADGEEGHQVTSSKLVPVVSNTELFTDYLSTLDGEAVHNDEQALQLTTDVVNTLQSNIASAVLAETDNETERAVLNEFAEDGLRTFAAMDAKYKELGIDSPAAYQRRLEAGSPQYLGDDYNRWVDAQRYERTYRELEDYVTYWGRGVLPERVKFGPTEAMADPENMTYYFDGMQDHLASEVDDVIGLIGPENTTEYGEELAQAKLSAMERVLEDMPGQWYDGDRNRTLLQDNITRLRAVVGPKV
jgi:hypothetical protein